MEEKLTRIDEVAGGMGASLRSDRERDAAGFAQNYVRSAVPAALHLTRYGVADNAPVGVETSAPFRENQQMLRGTEKFLRAFGQLKLKMEHAYRYEISAFQEAGPEAQGSYNLMAPAPPARLSAELRPIASLWAERFRPDDGLNLGTETAKLQEAISVCVENAKLGDFADCHPGTDPVTLPAHAEGVRSVADYLASGRIVRMRAFVIENGAPSSRSAGLSACANVDGLVNRLPTAEEAERVAPLVAGYGGGANKSIWISDTNTCRNEERGLAFFSNPLAGPTSTGCDRWTVFNAGSRSMLCVPQSGPVGKRDDL
jgi:hypothetical protein